MAGLKRIIQLGANPKLGILLFKSGGIDAALCCPNLSSNLYGRLTHSRVMASKAIGVDRKESGTVTEISNESLKIVPQNPYSNAQMQKVMQLVARGIPLKDAKVLVTAMTEALDESWKTEELNVNPKMLRAYHRLVIAGHEIEMLRRDIKKWHGKTDASIARERSLLDLDGRCDDELAKQSAETTNPIKRLWNFFING